MILLWLLMYYILIYSRHLLSTNKFLEAYNLFDASTGTISSIVFFVHIMIVGQRKRNAFRNRSHYHSTSSNSKEEIE